MLLTIDIGNTALTFGVFKGKKLTRHWRLATNRADARTLSRNLRGKFEGVCVSSVVPRLNTILKMAIKRRLGCNTLFVTPKNAGIKIARYNKRQIGADRLVNAVAAYHIYKKPCIVIDFGTATTFDYVTAKGEYGGGVIAPGIGIINEALSKMASKLPKVQIKKTRRIVARNTQESMQAGIFHGYVGLVDHIVSKMKRELKINPKVVVTGGLAAVIAKATKSIESIRPHLTLEGLRIIWERNS